MTAWSYDCPVRAGFPIEQVCHRRKGCSNGQIHAIQLIRWWGSTHKDIHVAALVCDIDQMLEAQRFSTIRQGFKLTLTWMRSFGNLQKIGVECADSYGAGLLRYLQDADVEVLEVTTPDRLDRRRRDNSDDFDAQSAAHAMPPLPGAHSDPRAAGAVW